VNDIQIGQIILLITTAGGFIAQAWREARNRKWAIADRRAELDAQTEKIIAEAHARASALMIETAAKAKVLHFEQLERAEEIRAHLTTQDAALAAHDEWERDERATAQVSNAQVVGLIQEAKTAAESAYTEANNVNAKIADLNTRLLREEQKPV